MTSGRWGPGHRYGPSPRSASRWGLLARAAHLAQSDEGAVRASAGDFDSAAQLFAHPGTGALAIEEQDGVGVAQVVFQVLADLLRCAVVQRDGIEQSVAAPDQRAQAPGQFAVVLARVDEDQAPVGRTAPGLGPGLSMRRRWLGESAQELLFERLQRACNHLRCGQGGAPRSESMTCPKSSAGLRHWNMGRPRARARWAWMTGVTKPSWRTATVALSI